MYSGDKQQPLLTDQAPRRRETSVAQLIISIHVNCTLFIHMLAALPMFLSISCFETCVLGQFPYGVSVLMLWGSLTV